MRYLIICIVLSLTACMTSDPGPDTRLDAATSCVSTGDGRPGSPCCVWDPDGPCQTPTACAWSGGGQSDGFCQADSTQPSRFYEPCDPSANSCYPGGVCMPAPGATTPTCRVICRPGMDRLYCGVDHTCVPISTDGEVGQCVSKDGH